MIFTQIFNYSFYYTVGNACRHQVNSVIRKKYRTLEEAEEDLGVNYFTEGLQDPSQKICEQSTPVSSHTVADTTPLSPVFGHSPHVQLKDQSCHGDAIANIIGLLSTMTSKLRADFIQNLFMYFLSVEFGSHLLSFVPSDFIKLCYEGFKVLYENKKENILYHLARGLGIPREDGTGPRLPVNRMPFGLLSYNIRYFSSDTVNKLSADPDYIEWESSMYSNFGHKWICLQRGPGFAYDAAETERSQEESSSTEGNPCSIGTGISVLQQAWQETFGDNINANCAEDSCLQEDVQPTDSADCEHSFLWARLSNEEKEAVCLGDDPVVIEELHGVKPQSQKRKKQVDPMKAKVNVAGHSVRTIQRHIQSTAFTRDSNVQVCQWNLIIELYKSYM